MTDRMHAIILAAGIGRRFQPEPLEHPKCLLEFGGKTLLARSIECLLSAGIEKVTVVAGFRCDLIEQEVARLETGSKIDVRYNPKYEGGSAGSVVRVRDVLESYPTLMLDADILYDARIMERMIQSADANAVLVDCGNTTATNEYWFTWNGQRLTGLYKGERLPQAIGVYWGVHKFAPGAGKIFVELAAAALERDPAMEYWWVTPRLLQRVSVSFVDVAGLTYFEMDSWQDVEWAREHVYLRLTD